MTYLSVAVFDAPDGPDSGPNAPWKRYDGVETEGTGTNYCLFHRRGLSASGTQTFKDIQTLSVDGKNRIFDNCLQRPSKLTTVGWPHSYLTNLYLFLIEGLFRYPKQAQSKRGLCRTLNKRLPPVVREKILVQYSSFPGSGSRVPEM